MTILPITALFAGLLVLWHVFLTMQTSFARAKHKVSLGNGERGSELNRVVRVHGNAAEQIALFIVVSALLEYHGLRPEVLYVLGAVFVLGRLLHRKALLTARVSMRIWAMQLTLWPLAIGAGILLYTWLVQVVLL